ncbi:hypothetical protein N2152v2_004349 [Parachlorella kessleri]
MLNHPAGQTAWGKVAERPTAPAAFMDAAQGPTTASSRGEAPGRQYMAEQPALRAASAVAEGMWDQLTFLTAFLLAFFPAWVLGAAALGCARPAAFAWFNAASATSALSISMFFIGLSLSLEVTLLPALAGLALAEAFPHAVAKMRPLSALSAVGLVTCTSGSNVANTAHILLRVGPQVVAAVLLLHAGGFLLGAACSRALGLPERTARTYAFQLGMRNSALAALLAALHFPGHPLAAVPCALSACAHTILGCLVAAWWRWRVPGSEPRGPQQAQQLPLLAPLVACYRAACQQHIPQLLGMASSLLAATQEQLAAPTGQAQELSLLGTPPTQRLSPTAVSLLVAVLQLPAVGLAPVEVPKVPEPPLPPPPNPNAMNIIMVGAECAPWSKTGGLGDVMQALPKALAARGHRVMVVAPRYQPYEDAWETGIRLRLRVFTSNQEAS